MPGLNEVATWTGLLAAVIGIALSIVAIWFTFAVDRRSRVVTEQTIKSLQKIESSVERLSSDTQNLIKAGWDKLLGTVGQEALSAPGVESTTNIEQIAAGLSEELRADLNERTPAGSPYTQLDPEALEQIANRVERTVQRQLRTSQGNGRVGSSQRIDRWIKVIADLSPSAYALAKIVTRYVHLSRDQYLGLIRNTTLSDALTELRDDGILVPLSHSDDRSALVYWLPPGDRDYIKAAFSIIDRTYVKERDFALEKLVEIGYLVKHDDHFDAARAANRSTQVSNNNRSNRRAQTESSELRPGNASDAEDNRDS